MHGCMDAWMTGADPIILERGSDLPEVSKPSYVSHRLKI